MRYLYRPHRGGLGDSMEKCILCRSEDAVKDEVISEFAPFGVTLTRDDVIIDDRKMDDRRIGWRETQYVCVKHMGEEQFDVPQCVGMCCSEESFPNGFFDEIEEKLTNNERPSFSIRAE